MDENNDLGIVMDCNGTIISFSICLVMATYLFSSEVLLSRE